VTKKAALRGLFFAFLACGSAAQGADGATARSLAATCANCHGTDGRSASPDIASLAGMPREKLAAQMKAFRDGSRPATVMHQLARGYTDRQVELLADYFAAQKP
jgi:sulfide dehydrogenase cytochrome subunit